MVSGFGILGFRGSGNEGLGIIPACLDFRDCGASGF